MTFPGRTRAQERASVLTHLTSRDGVPHVRLGEPECGDRIQRGTAGLFSQVEVRSVKSGRRLRRTDSTEPKG